MAPLHPPSSRRAAARPQPPALWWYRALAVVAVVGVLALAAPLIWRAASAGLGLLALGAIAGLAFAAVQAVPWLLQRLENRLLAARKAEARANPVEQLHNECLRRAQRLQRFREALVAIGGQIESLRDMIDERRRAAPGQSLEREERALQRMAQFHEVNVGRLHEAQAALEAFQDQVQHKVWQWEFAQAGRVIMEQLSPEQAEELTQSLLSDEALRAVQLRFNEVFASLDIDLTAPRAPTRELLDPAEASRLDELRLPLAGAAAREVSR